MEESKRKIVTDKQAELCNLLRELAKDYLMSKGPKARSDVYLKLEQIYYIDAEKKFRHFYSDFFPIIVEIDNDAEQGSTEILTHNLKYLMQNYQVQNKIGDSDKYRDISDELAKLYDHINLDVARLTHFTQNFSKAEDELENLSEESKRIRRSVQKANNAEKNYITILGIFASIVLTFTGGIAFSTSVLENIDAISPYRLALVIEALSFVLINVMYILVWFISRIHDDNEIKYPRFMMSLNLILVAAVITTLALWRYGIC